MYDIMSEKKLLEDHGPSVEIPSFSEFVMAFMRALFPTLFLTMEDFSWENAPRVREALWEVYATRYDKELVLRHIVIMQLMAKAQGLLNDEQVEKPDDHGPSVQIPSFSEFVMAFVRETYPSVHLTMKNFSEGKAPGEYNGFFQTLRELYSHRYNAELQRRHVAILQVLEKAQKTLEQKRVK